jgi:amino acid transporter
MSFWRAFGVAMLAVYWPYDGWINIGPVAEEIREPKRNVPLGLGVGMLIIIAVYVATNIGYHLTLPMSHIQQTQTIASDVFEVLFGPIGASLAALGVMVSTFGALNSNLLAGPRIYFAMARDGLFPKAIRRVHPTFRTPANAILAQSTWAVAQIVIVFWLTTNPKSAFDTLTDFVILGGTVFYSLTVAAVFVLRYKMPDRERPYRTWGYPVTPLLYLLASAAVVASVQPTQLLAVGALLVVGLGVYVFFRVYNRNLQRETPPVA